MHCRPAVVQGISMFVCGPRKLAKPESCDHEGCGRVGGVRCDEVVRDGPQARTCDRWGCALHAVKIGPDRHRCTQCEARRTAALNPALEGLRDASLFRNR